MFWITNVAQWFHICPQTSQYLLAQLVDYVGCCYQPHVGLNLLVGRWCSGIAFCDYPYLNHRRCIVSSFTPLVVWVSVNHSSRWARYFCFWEGASCNGRIYQPWSSWMLVAVGYERKIIPILTVISHYIVFMHQSEWKDVGYPLWVIPERIWVSMEVTNVFV